VLEDERLRGTAPVAADLADLLALFGDPRVGETLGGVRTEAQVRQTLTRWERRWAERGIGPWLFRDRTTGDCVGYAGLADAAEAIEPGGIELLYGLQPGFWGRGLAVRMASLALDHAFAEQGVREVVAYTLDSNRRSQRVLEKLGFGFERNVEHAGLPHRLYRLRGPG
jgi:RimJ/RimL family protein N-acetyltransferase